MNIGWCAERDSDRGGTEGPLGDQKKATIAFASVWDFDNVRMSPDPCKSDNDLDQDGHFEVRASARFAIGCGGKPYTEDFVLKITQDKISRMETGEALK
jgi:hypothetical protein